MENFQLKLFTHRALRLLIPVFWISIIIILCCEFEFTKKELTKLNKNSSITYINRITNNKVRIQASLLLPLSDRWELTRIEADFEDWSAIPILHTHFTKRVKINAGNKALEWEEDIIYTGREYDDISDGRLFEKVSILHMYSNNQSNIIYTGPDEEITKEINQSKMHTLGELLNLISKKCYTDSPTVFNSFKEFLKPDIFLSD